MLLFYFQHKSISSPIDEQLEFIIIKKPCSTASNIDYNYVILLFFIFSINKHFYTITPLEKRNSNRVKRTYVSFVL